jgi:chromosome segregation ATPase
LLIAEVIPAHGSSGYVAQPQTGAQEKLASLRLQLSELEAKQSELQTRLQQLDENLKPENIEHSLAGVGSTRPEELREQRRRQLEIERNGVRAQLDLLAASHTRLQSAIARAEADAYRESAAPVINASAEAAGGATGGTEIRKRPKRLKKKKKRSRRVGLIVNNANAAATC